LLLHSEDRVTRQVTEMVTGDADRFEAGHDDPKYHYSHPAKNPAQSPGAVRARSANEPVDGAGGSLLPSIRITSMIRTTVMA
jgi:hypothetical protein